MSYRGYIAAIVLLAGGAASATPAGMALIPNGTYRPVLRGKDELEQVPVDSFLLDVRPVTNAEFLEFVRAVPRWRRSAISPLFGDSAYLSNWAGDLELGSNVSAGAPVVHVSWFAARAYATWRGKRLPTTAEWERAADVGYTVPDGRSDPELEASALDWLSRPSPAALAAAGSGRPNFYGVRDMLTLVWEWVDDFNTALVTGESRADSGLDRDLFCGAGSIGATDLENYPAFIRAGMRSSLKANYAVGNLGFRCAKDL